jgi:hypothetical protein
LWVVTLIIMYFRGYLSSEEVLGGTIPHAILGTLFVAAFIKTSPAGTRPIKPTAAPMMSSSKLDFRSGQ